MRTLATILVAASLVLTPTYKASTCDPCTTSDNGQAILRQFEGYYWKPYPDSAGRMTIGYGHLLRAGENFRYLTPAQAIKLLQTDLLPKEKAINADVPRKKYQIEFDALSCLVFNIGESAFHASHLRAHVQTDINVDPFWLEWDKITVNGKKEVSAGILARRKVELALYVSKVAH